MLVAQFRLAGLDCQDRQAMVGASVAGVLVDDGLVYLAGLVGFASYNFV